LIELARARGGFDNITVAVVPLQGTLKKDPPAGYERKRREELDARARALEEPSDRMTVFVTTAVLCVVASALTLFWMLFRLSR
jgi:hypothetical protein